MNPDGLHHKEAHLLQGIKISFLVIVILAKILDIRQLIAESMKGTHMTRNMNGVNIRYGNNHGFVNISYNSFSPLMDKNIACYKCNYLGHKA
jgi:hypothetical protein